MSLSIVGFIYCSDFTGDNAKVIREVGIKLCEAIIAYNEEEYNKATDLLMSIRYDIIRIGGSHAQVPFFWLIQIPARPCSCQHFHPPPFGEVRAYHFSHIGLYAVLHVFSYVGPTPILLRKMILEDCVRKLDSKTDLKSSYPKSGLTTPVGWLSLSNLTVLIRSTIVV